MSAAQRSSHSTATLQIIKDVSPRRRKFSRCVKNVFSIKSLEGRVTKKKEVLEVCVPLREEN